jgi:hypothetical protein
MGLLLTPRTVELGQECAAVPASVGRREDELRRTAVDAVEARSADCLAYPANLHAETARAIRDESPSCVLNHRTTSPDRGVWTTDHRTEYRTDTTPTHHGRMSAMTTEQTKHPGGRPSLDGKPGRTPQRQVRIPDDEYYGAVAKAKAEGKKFSDVVRELLREYLDRP